MIHPGKPASEPPPAHALAIRSLILTGLLIVASLAAEASWQAAPASAETTDSASAPSNLLQAGERCRIRAGRAVLDTVVEQGDAIDVSAWMDLDCGWLPPATLDLVLLLDVQPLTGEEPDADYAETLYAGLRAGLDRLGWAQGSRAALMRVANAGHSVDMELTEDRVALDEALQDLGGEGLDEEGDMGPALDAARGLLEAAATEGRQGAILLVDAGMALRTNDEGGVLNPPAAACRRATDAGLALGVISLPAASRRLANDCASPGHYQLVDQPEAPRLDSATEQMLRVLAHPGSIVRAELSDYIASSFEYVEGTGVPRDPDYIVLSEHVWRFEPREQRLEQRLDYRTLVRPGFGELITPLSVDSKLIVEYADGSTAEHPLPNPELCIHWPGREGFCLDWLRQAGLRLYLPRLERP